MLEVISQDHTCRIIHFNSKTLLKDGSKLILKKPSPNSHLSEHLFYTTPELFFDSIQFKNFI